MEVVQGYHISNIQQTGGSSVSTSTNGGTHTGDWNYNLQFRAVDAVGNAGPWTGKYNVKIDKTAPSVPTISGGHSGTWMTANYAISFSSSDSVSGIAKYQWSTSTTGGWQDISNPFTYSSEGNYTHYYRAVNGAGLASGATAGNNIKIDKSAPGAPTISGAYNNTWKTANYNVTLSSSENVSGISTYQYSFNNSSWTNCGSTYTCSGDQNRTIYFIFFLYVI